MSVYGLGKNTNIDNIFNDTVSKEGSFLDTQQRESIAQFNSSINLTNNLSDARSTLEIDHARAYVFNAYNTIQTMMQEIDSNLLQVVIDPYANLDLETAHRAVWKDATKHKETAKELSEPSFICYEQYQFAEKHKCRACRSFIKEYELAVSHSSFGHLIEVKKSLSYLLNEATLLRNIVINYLGDDYVDETESQIAKYITDWAKSATHYTQQFAKEITAKPIAIPQSELDQISKKQAAQFQAFFSIKINSLQIELQTLLSLIKRDSVDLGETFYSNFLLPALNFKSKVVDPLMLEVSTTDLKTKAPKLMQEMYVANSAITGNLGSVTADFLERNNQVYKRFDAFLQAIRLKRKYVNYLSQLETMGVNRNLVLITDEIEDLEKYKQTFKTIYVDNSKRESLRSSHGELDDIDEDAHPQYLRKDGGIITGDLFFADGVKIAGIDLSNHSHSGEDGSAPIPANAIDYTAARAFYAQDDTDRPYGQLTLVSLEETGLVGGVRQFEAVVEIEIEDDKQDTYEFEILYKEL
jgi:hypothetical protein